MLASLGAPSNSRTCLNAGINSRRQDRPSRPAPPLPAKPAPTHGLGYAESLAKQVGMTGALGDPDDTELVDMSARYRALSQRPISTNSAIRAASQEIESHSVTSNSRCQRASGRRSGRFSTDQSFRSLPRITGLPAASASRHASLWQLSGFRRETGATRINRRDQDCEWPCGTQSDQPLLACVCQLPGSVPPRLSGVRPVGRPLVAKNQRSPPGGAGIRPGRVLARPGRSGPRPARRPARRAPCPPGRPRPAAPGTRAPRQPR
jgi:hypothetical protein